MSNISTFFSGVFTSYIKLFVTTLVGLWMVPFILKYLSLSEYGIYVILIDIIIWLQLMQFGTSTSLSIHASQLDPLNQNKLKELYSSAFFMQLLAAFLVFVAGFYFAKNPSFLINENSEIKGIFFIIILFICSACIKVASLIFGSILTARKKIYALNLIGLGAFIFQTLVAIILLKSGYGLMGMAISTLSSALFLLFVSYIFIRIKFPFLALSPRSLTISKVKLLFFDGAWFSIGGLAGMMIFNLDKILIGKYIDLETVTIFVICGKLYFLAYNLHNQIFNVLRPYIGSSHGQRRFNRLRNIYTLGINQSLYFSISFACFIYLINETFIRIWVGDGFYGGNLLSLLLAYNFIFQSCVLVNRVFLSSALFKVKAQNSIRIIEGGFNIFLSIYFIKLFGVIGVMLGSIISSIIFSNIFLNILTYKYFKSYKVSINPRTYLMNFYLVIPVLIYFGSFNDIYIYLSISLFFIFTVSIISTIKDSEEYISIIKYVKNIFLKI